MPRNRTVRLAVLGSSVQRPAARYPSRSASALRRRLVVGGLVMLSLALITLSFRSEGVSGPQAAGAALLRPFQVGAERVARPFRDAYGWFSGLVDAKEEADRLRRELAAAREEAARFQLQAAENERLRAITGYRAPAGLADFDLVPAAVVAYPGPFSSQVTVAAGSDAGVTEDASVVSAEGALVGRVTAVTGGQARVMLLVDGASAVSATDVQTRARGVVRGRPGSDTLSLDFVVKDDRVQEGDTVVTAGSQHGELESRYPRGIRIGRVTYASSTDTDPFKTVQIEPFVDFDGLESVMVLVRKRSAR